MKEEKKTSKEILSELFDKFNATPPSSPPVHSVDKEPLNNESEKKKSCKKSKRKESKDKSKKKRKKEKKKSKKHKSKKSKKKLKRRSSKSTTNSSCDESFSGESASDAKSSLKKRLKKKKLNDSVEGSDIKKSTNQIITNIKKEKTSIEEDIRNDIPNESVVRTGKSEIPKVCIKTETNHSEIALKDRVSNDNLSNNASTVSESNLDLRSITLPDVVPVSVPNESKFEERETISVPQTENVLQVADIFVEELLESTFASKGTALPEKAKANIKIIDLKKSNILELAEQKQKEKADKYEEGEITSDSCEEDNDALPTLQPVESDDISLAIGNIEEGIKEKIKRCRRKSSHKSRIKKNKDKDRSHSRDHVKLKRTRSLSKEKPSRSRSRGTKRRKSGSVDKKVDKDKHRDKEKHGSKSGHKKKKESEAKSSKEKKEEKYEKDKKDIDKKEDKGKRDSKDKSKKSKERRSRSRERRRNKSKSPLQLPSMILQENSKKKRRSRSRSRTRGLEIDKKKLLEIARKNALSMLKHQGSVAATDSAKVATITAGGKTVDELTDFCKQLSQKEGKDDNIDLSPISDSSEDEGEKAFHHPFLIKDRPTNIVMNIRNCAALPVKTHQEKTAEAASQLRLQFPVSSGQHHRRSENEWVPVEPKKDEPAANTAKAIKGSCKATPVVDSSPLAIEPPPLPPPELTSVFPSVEESFSINIGDVVGQKLAATKRLQDNPGDYSAMKLLQDAEDKLSRWNESNQLQQPGLFTGSTGARLLTPAELASGQQAWAKKDQLMCAQPVTGGIGSHLLQKMGWKPGEGLGKNHEGTLEPLSLPLKMDKRGLVCAEEVKKPPRFINNTRFPKKQTVKSLEGKHPVSLLLEYCTKRHINPPIFTVCLETGPSHKKYFLFKVQVNGVEYQPSMPSNNKKQAKSEAAMICLQALGLMPSTSVPLAALEQ